MSALFAKMNLKDQTTITVLDAPASFEAALAALKGVTVQRHVRKGDAVQFGIAFATTQKALDAASKVLTAAAEGDAILWIAYPKGSSKRYTCEFNRDSGWTVLGTAGFEPVRQVAIDEDWSALRFRRASFVKTVTRDPSRALTSEGKARAAAAKQTAPRTPRATKSATTKSTTTKSTTAKSTTARTTTKPSARRAR